MVVLVQVAPDGTLIAAEAIEGRAVLAKREGPAVLAAGGALRGSWLVKGLSWGRMALFLGVTAYELYHAQPAQRLRIAVSATGGLAAGAVGGYLLCNVLLGIETAGLSLFGCLFVAGGVAGVSGTMATGAAFDVLAPPPEGEWRGMALEEGP